MSRVDGLLQPSECLVPVAKSNVNEGAGIGRDVTRPRGVEIVQLFECGEGLAPMARPAVRVSGGGDEIRRGREIPGLFDLDDGLVEALRGGAGLSSGGIARA